MPEGVVAASELGNGFAAKTLIQSSAFAVPHGVVAADFALDLPPVSALVRVVAAIITKVTAKATHISGAIAGAWEARSPAIGRLSVVPLHLKACNATLVAGTCFLGWPVFVLHGLSGLLSRCLVCGRHLPC